MADNDESDWSKLTVVVLKEHLKTHGLNTTGRKADLVNRLREYERTTGSLTGSSANNTPLHEPSNISVETTKISDDSVSSDNEATFQESSNISTETEFILAPEPSVLPETSQDVHEPGVITEEAQGIKVQLVEDNETSTEESLMLDEPVTNTDTSTCEYDTFTSEAEDINTSGAVTSKIVGYLSTDQQSTESSVTLMDTTDIQPESLMQSHNQEKGENEDIFQMKPLELISVDNAPATSCMMDIDPVQAATESADSAKIGNLIAVENIASNSDMSHMMDTSLGQNTDSPNIFNTDDIVQTKSDESTSVDNTAVTSNLMDTSPGQENRNICQQMAPFDDSCNGKTNAVCESADSKLLESHGSTENKHEEELQESTQIKPVESHESTENKPVELHQSTENKPEELHQSTEVKNEELHQSTEVKPVESHESTESKPKELHQSTEVKPVETHESTENKPEELHESTEVKHEELHQSTEVKPVESHENTENKHEELHESTEVKHEELHQSTEVKPVESHESTENKPEELHQSTEVKPAESHEIIENKHEELHQSTEVKPEELHDSTENKHEELHQSTEIKPVESHESTKNKHEELHENTEVKPVEIHVSSENNPEELHDKTEIKPTESHKGTEKKPEELHQSTEMKHVDTHESTENKHEELNQSTEVKKHEELSERTEVKPMETHESTENKHEDLHQSTEVKPVETHVSTEKKHEELHERTEVKPMETHESTEIKHEELHQSTKVKPVESHESIENKSEELHQSTEIKPVETHESTENKPEELHDSTENKPEELHDSTEIAHEELHQSTEIKPVETHESTKNKHEELHENTEVKPVEIHVSSENNPEELHDKTEIKPTESHESTENKPEELHQSTEVKPVESHESTEDKHEKLHQSTEVKPVETDESTENKPEELHDSTEIKPTESHKGTVKKHEELHESTEVKHEESLESTENKPEELHQSTEVKPVESLESTENKPEELHQSIEVKPAKSHDSTENKHEDLHQSTGVKPVETDESTDNKPKESHKRSEEKHDELHRGTEIKPMESHESSENKHEELHESTENKPVETHQSTEIKPVKSPESTENRPKESLASTEMKLEGSNESIEISSDKEQESLESAKIEDSSESEKKENVILAEDEESEGSCEFPDFADFVVIDEAGSEDDESFERAREELKEKELKDEEIKLPPPKTTVPSCVPELRNLCQNLGLVTGISGSQENETTTVNSTEVVSTAEVAASVTDPTAGSDQYSYTWAGYTYPHGSGFPYVTEDCGICNTAGHHVMMCPRKHLFCVTCSKIGHIQTECPGNVYTGWCPRCSLYGHLPTECPKNHCQCNNCFQMGHTVEECVEPLRPPGPEWCPRCNILGHVPQTCPINFYQCTNCQQYGHSVEECHAPPKPTDWCKRCNIVDHLAENCPKNKCQCLKCGNLGHLKEECQEKPDKCPRCDKSGHFMNECPQNVLCGICKEKGHTSLKCLKRQSSSATGKTNEREDAINKECENIGKDYYGGWTIYCKRQHLQSKDTATNFFSRFDKILDMRMYDYADKIFIGFMSKDGASKAMKLMWETRFEPKVATINKNFKTSEPPALTMEEFDLLSERRKALEEKDKLVTKQSSSDDSNQSENIEDPKKPVQHEGPSVEDNINKEVKKLKKDHFQLWNVCINRYTIRNEEIAKNILSRFGEVSEVRLYKKVIFVSYMTQFAASNAVRGLWDTKYLPTVPTVNTNYKSTVPKAVTMEEISLHLEATESAADSVNTDTVIEDPTSEEGNEQMIEEELQKLKKDYYGAWNIIVKPQRLKNKDIAKKYFKTYGNIAEVRTYEQSDAMFIGFMTQDGAVKALKTLWDSKFEARAARVNPNFKSTVPHSLTLEELEILQSALVEATVSEQSEKDSVSGDPTSVALTDECISKNENMTTHESTFVTEASSENVETVENVATTSNLTSTHVTTMTSSENTTLGEDNQSKATEVTYCTDTDLSGEKYSNQLSTTSLSDTEKKLEEMKRMLTRTYVESVTTDSTPTDDVTEKEANNDTVCGENMNASLKQDKNTSNQGFKDDSIAQQLLQDFLKEIEETSTKPNENEETIDKENDKVNEIENTASFQNKDIAHELLQDIMKEKESHPQPQESEQKTANSEIVYEAIGIENKSSDIQKLNEALKFPERNKDDSILSSESKQKLYTSNLRESDYTCDSETNLASVVIDKPTTKDTSNTEIVDSTEESKISSRISVEIEKKNETDKIGEKDRANEKKSASTDINIETIEQVVSGKGDFVNVLPGDVAISSVTLSDGGKDNGGTIQCDMEIEPAEMSAEKIGRKIVQPNTLDNLSKSDNDIQKGNGEKLFEEIECDIDTTEKISKKSDPINIESGNNLDRSEEFIGDNILESVFGGTSQDSITVRPKTDFKDTAMLDINSSGTETISMSFDEEERDISKEGIQDMGTEKSADQQIKNINLASPHQLKDVRVIIKKLTPKELALYESSPSKLNQNEIKGKTVKGTNKTVFEDKQEQITTDIKEGLDIKESVYVANQGGITEKDLAQKSLNLKDVGTKLLDTKLTGLTAPKQEAKPQPVTDTVATDNSQVKEVSKEAQNNSKLERSSEAPIIISDAKTETLEIQSNTIATKDNKGSTKMTSIDITMETNLGKDKPKSSEATSVKEDSKATNGAKESKKVETEMQAKVDVSGDKSKPDFTVDKDVTKDIGKKKEEITMIYPAVLLEWMNQKVSNTMMMSRLYISQIGPKDLMCAPLMEWANKSSYFYINRQLEQDRAAALLQYSSEKKGKEAKESLTVALGEGVKIIHPSKRHDEELYKIFPEHIEAPAITSSSLVITGLLEGVAEEDILNLIPKSLLVCDPKIMSLEINWIDHKTTYLGQKFLLPENLKGAYFVRCSSNDAANAAGEKQEIDFKGEKLTIQLFNEFSTIYRDDFWDMCMKKYNVKGSSTSRMIEINSRKRKSYCEDLKEYYLDADQDIKEYGINKLDYKLLEKIMKLKQELNMDATRRVRVGLAIPEQKKLMTKHTRLIKRLVQQGKTDALNQIIGGPVIAEKNKATSESSKDGPKIHNKAVDRNKKPEKEQNNSPNSFKDNKKEREQSTRKRSRERSEGKDDEKIKARKTSKDQDMYDCISDDSEINYASSSVNPGPSQSQKIELYVGLLPTNLNKVVLTKNLNALFKPYNMVMFTKFMAKPQYLYTFAVFDNTADASNAKRNLDGIEFHGQRMKVDFANKGLRVFNPTIRETKVDNEKDHKYAVGNEKDSRMTAVLNRISADPYKGWYTVTVDRIEKDVTSLFSKYGEIVHIKFEKDKTYVSFLHKSGALRAVESLWGSEWNIDAVEQVAVNLWCSKCKEKGHTSSDCDKKGKLDVVCSKCNMEGHSSRDCKSSSKVRSNCVYCGSASHLNSSCPKKKEDDEYQIAIEKMVKNAKMDDNGWYTISIDIHSKHYTNKKDVKEQFREYGDIKHIECGIKRINICYSSKRSVENVLKDKYKTSWDARIEEPKKHKSSYQKEERKYHKVDISKSNIPGNTFIPRSIRTENKPKQKKKKDEDLFNALEDDLFINDDVKKPIEDVGTAKKQVSKYTHQVDTWNLEKLANMLDNFQLDMNGWASLSIYNEGQLLNETIIKSMFIKYGEVKIVRLHQEMAYISFANMAHAIKAIEELWGTKWNIQTTANSVWCTRCQSEKHWTNLCTVKVDKPDEGNSKKLNSLKKNIASLKPGPHGGVLIGIHKNGKVMSRQTVSEVFSHFGALKSVEDTPLSVFLIYEQWASAVKALKSMALDSYWDLYVPETRRHSKSEEYDVKGSFEKESYCISCKNYGHKAENCTLTKRCLICAKPNCFEPLHIQIAENLKKNNPQKTIITGVKPDIKKTTPSVERKGALGGILSHYKSDVSDDDDIVDRSLSSESDVADIVGTDRAAEQELMNMSKDSSGHWPVCVAPDPFYNIQMVDVLQKFLKYGRIKDIKGGNGTFIVKFKTLSRARNAVREMWGTMWKVSVPHTYISPLELQYKSRSTNKSIKSGAEGQKLLAERVTRVGKRKKESISNSSYSDSDSSEGSRSRSYDRKADAPWSKKKKKDKKKKKLKEKYTSKSQKRQEMDTRKSDKKTKYKGRDDDIRSPSKEHIRSMERLSKDERKTYKDRSRSYDSDNQSSRSHSRSVQRSRSRSLERKYHEEKIRASDESHHRYERTYKEEQGSRSREGSYDRGYKESFHHDHGDSSDDMTEELYNLCEDYQGLWNISVINNGSMREIDVEELFEQYGNVRSVHMTQKRIYIGYASEKSARVAIYSLWGTKWDGRVPKKEQIAYMQQRSWESPQYDSRYVSRSGRDQPFTKSEGRNRWDEREKTPSIEKKNWDPPSKTRSRNNKEWSPDKYSGTYDDSPPPSHKPQWQRKRGEVEDDSLLPSHKPQWQRKRGEVEDDSPLPSHKPQWQRKREEIEDDNPLPSHKPQWQRKTGEVEDDSPLPSHKPQWQRKRGEVEDDSPLPSHKPQWQRKRGEVEAQRLRSLDRDTKERLEHSGRQEARSTERSLRRQRSPSLDDEGPREKKSKDSNSGEPNEMVASVIQGLKDVLSSKVDELVKLGSSDRRENVVQGLLQSIDVMKQKGVPHNLGSSASFTGTSTSTVGARAGSVPQVPPQASYVPQQAVPQGQLTSHPSLVTRNPHVMATQAAGVRPDLSANQPQIFQYNQQQQPAGYQSVQQLPYIGGRGQQPQPAVRYLAQQQEAAARYPAQQQQQALPPGWQYYQQTIASLGRGLPGANLLQSRRPPGNVNSAQPGSGYPGQPNVAGSYGQPKSGQH